MSSRIAATITTALALALIATETEAACTPGAEACPMAVEMARGADTITLRGTLSQNRDRCAYALRARAGQVMTWRVTGPAIRTTIRYPDGEMDGPGLPMALPLPESGVYVFTVHPNLMAEGAFGPFALAITIR